MQDLPNKVKKELELLFAHVTKEVSLLHVSRATPALVEHLSVAAYGGKMPLVQVASIATPDARTILVQPWDTALIPEIQKAVQNSNLGMGLSVDEKFVRLTMPQLSEERRREITKVLGRKIEEARINARKVRDSAMKELEGAEKAKSISQDEKFRLKDGVQKVIDEYNENVHNLEEKKEREISGNI